jgi:uncharacterized protein (TIGR00299 family) protein
VKILYFDPILGVSGDMILAALIDLGVPADYLRRQLRFVGDFQMKVGVVDRNGVKARNLKFTYQKQIKEDRFIPMIRRSSLSAPIKMTGTKIFERIFAVEKKVHRTHHLHLHELADTDTLLDIAGALVAVDYLKVDRIYTGPFKAGQGFIKTVEGNMPAFNFATAELLRGFPVQFLPIAAELTTPTGAAILSTIGRPKNEFILNQIHGIGMGAGTMDIPGYPNLLRVFIGSDEDLLTDECLVIETNIDDMNPQDYEILFQRLYEAGALEVFLTSTIMKHSRPGILLTVLSDVGKPGIIDMIFEQTTTLGLRISRTARLKLKRKIARISTPYGMVRIKTFEFCGRRRFALEYRDLKRLARARDIPIARLRATLMADIEKSIKKAKVDA